MDPQIDQSAAATSQPTPVQPVPPSPKSKLPLILLVIILLVIVGAGGVVLGKYLEGSKTPAMVASEISSVPTETPTPTSDPTVNWKTYQSDNLSFEYPPSLNIVPNNNSGAIVTMKFKEEPDCNNCSRIISLFVGKVTSNIIDSKLTSFINQLYGTTSSNFEKIQIGGELGIISIEDKGIPAQEYGQGSFVVHNNTLFRFILSTWNTTKDLNHQSYFTIKQILSTFKFLQ
ncbi:hypothetical protein COT44_04295 [Candidatus Shapirobacteria bacterium CG08_land_8_20_14_0_20_39_18]|uniref:Uncharacterized protein n=1 Tax=Candidatus Shapirobacteria bacterium CG08_land_8_20_14_0_20_39_18 TaxID=1974883 RepID=A0A2M6XC88_9BACT|nr:MAG: hypothetical protein COT44_04295 [Candidatus Shapirobacteria bacterium CG08_land_8_20_14_0_20_39_18]PIY66381.1 MAG: hypothetical protein COY91_00370 [Candidatus Shapirobacteria bacterium CG_4_10_14_0_8_um_filter_39_15]PJE68319.1 MAG: hypothetical protein COU94_02535 [Candidatus Shapirobacteria bacterium CG10_big_fil_rev_8_21_14_0_10_38_8]